MVLDLVSVHFHFSGEKVGSIKVKANAYDLVGGGLLPLPDSCFSPRAI